MGKRPTVSAVTYKKGTRTKAVVRALLNRTGKFRTGCGDVGQKTTRNGSSSDYNTVRRIAEFGNEAGFVTIGQLSLLGRIYNRVIGKGQRRSWSRLG